MKTTTLPIKAFLAALAAIVFLPVGPGAASIAFTLTGLLALLLSDYGREMEPIRIESNIVPFDFRGRKQAHFNQAA